MRRHIPLLAAGLIAAGWATDIRWNWASVRGPSARQPAAPLDYSRPIVIRTLSPEHQQRVFRPYSYSDGLGRPVRLADKPANDDEVLVLFLPLADGRKVQVAAAEVKEPAVSAAVAMGP